MKLLAWREKVNNFIGHTNGRKAAENKKHTYEKKPSDRYAIKIITDEP